MKNNFNYFFIFLKVFFILILVFVSFTPIFAQESNIIDEIIKGNDFILKADLSLDIGASYFFNYFTNNLLNDFFNIFCKFQISYEMFNWLDFYFNLNLRIGVDYYLIEKPAIYFNTNFNEIFQSLPFELNLKFGIYPEDLSIYKYFKDNNYPYYFGIAPYYISYELGATSINIKWFLIDFTASIFGFDKSAGFLKFIFSFYDFAYLSYSILIPISISSEAYPTSSYFELALSMGLFDILAYLAPVNYFDSALNKDLTTFSFGVNLSTYFIISSNHKFKVVVFGDYIDSNSQNGFKLIDYLNELYLQSNYSFGQKHPSRIGLGIEYEGFFGKNLSARIYEYLYYNFTLNYLVFDIYSKIKFYYFYFEVNYFPFYYPDIFQNYFEISLGVNFSL